MSVLNQYKNENERLEDRLRNLTSRRDHLQTVNARLALPLNGTFASFGSVVTSSSGTSSGLAIGSSGLSGLPMSGPGSMGPMSGGPGQPIPGLSLANFLPPHAPSLSGLINSANAGLRGVPNPNATEPFTINGQRFPLMPNSDGPSSSGLGSMYGPTSASGPFQGLLSAAMAVRNNSTSGSSTSASPSPFGNVSGTTPSPFSSSSMNAINSLSTNSNAMSNSTPGGSGNNSGGTKR